MITYTKIDDHAFDMHGQAVYPGDRLIAPTECDKNCTTCNNPRCYQVEVISIEEDVCTCVEIFDCQIAYTAYCKWAEANFPSCNGEYFWFVAKSEIKGRNSTFKISKANLPHARFLKR